MLGHQPPGLNPPLPGWPLSLTTPLPPFGALTTLGLLLLPVPDKVWILD